VHVDAIPALTTAVSDGERVIASFGNYGLVALDMDGKKVWEKRLPHPGYVFGVGSSPLLYDGLVVLSRDGAPEAGLLVFDAADGSELWRIDRFGFGESHGTPFLWRNADRDELVLVGNGKLCSYDPGTGEPLWSVGGLTNFPCTTPTAGQGHAVLRGLVHAQRGRPVVLGRCLRALARAQRRGDRRSVVALQASRQGRERSHRAGRGARVPRQGRVRLPRRRSQRHVGAPRDAGGKRDRQGGRRERHGRRRARGKDDASKDHVRWKWDRGLPYVSSPLLYHGRIWLFQAGGLVTVLDAQSGKPILDRERLPDRAEYYLSPVGAAGHVIAGSAEGSLYVLAADAKELKIEHSVAFDEELFATPAVLDGVVYVRTKTTLWAFGEPRKE
jgi:outer membrane protein assembly factor BamB